MTAPPVATMLLALCALACPTTALAGGPIAHSVDSSGNQTDYYTFDEVQDKAPNVDVIVMDKDWHLDSAFTVGVDQKVTIDMNGHKVDCRYTCFWVQNRAELVLTSSSDPVTFAYMGYNPQTGADRYVKSTTGGLVNTLSRESGGAFSVAVNAKLTLDKVTAGGSYGDGAAGGVNLDRNSTMTLKNGARIEYNQGTDGGGVYCSETGVTINIDNASISENYATELGGGVYSRYADTTINMSNGAKIANNSARAGGGIYFTESNFKVSSSDGNAYISDNTARDSEQSSSKSNQHGGGKAYITGTLAEGSAVGVRTGIEGDRRIAKSFKPASKDCLFYDMDGYYVSYGTGEGGDAWQRHTTKEFAVKINGEVNSRYKNGATATVVAPAFKGSRIFWRWDKDTTYGLNPIDDYLPDSALCGNVLAFTMPQNDVGLGAYYTTRAEAAKKGVPATGDNAAAAPVALLVVAGAATLVATAVLIRSGRVK